MRIIAGTYGGRPLKAAKGQDTRPTSDKVKGAIFSMIGPYFSGGYCLDFYGGSGNLAIEAVSRGMDHAFITEKYRPSVQVIRDNIAMTKEPDHFTLLSGDNRRSLVAYQGKVCFNYVFLDPPYAHAQIIEDVEWLMDHMFLADDVLIITETDPSQELPTHLFHYQLVKDKVYGSSRIRIYEGADQNDI